ncbi:probable protein phosphatase 2C 22 [Vicia villosa]|uniref:probable protein phosphatase 2C 22 n=1 Tax=Vicia villosa TaxID=3911 RepID=UPI00273BE009|nr:probable protein phosphatase 2C 22 [Vicia villosa]
MEESEGVNCCSGGRSPSESRPPNPNPSIASVYRQCQRNDPVVLPCRNSLVRHASLQAKMKLSDVSTGDVTEDFLPKLRSGGYADVGFRSSMEDVYVCVDHFMQDPGLNKHIGGPSAFYGVFDGHGGKHAADFACNHLPKFILEDKSFPVDIERIVASAFLQTDNAFAEACSLDAALASGTTALATLVIGRLLLVANAGDCRAVLCRNGKAIEMSRDHKPVCMKEQRRIEASGGYVYDGYLNGQLSVTRAIGDWHMEGMKGKDGGPLSAEPELMTTKLTAEDEFLIIGCDGIWDVFRSQNAVDFARRRLQDHNDPAVCSKDLVDEALKRKSGDNLAAVVVCFQQQPPPNLVAPRARVHRSFSAEGLKELQSFLDSLGK